MITSSRMGTSDFGVRLSVCLSLVALRCALIQELESISAKTEPSSHVAVKGGASFLSLLLHARYVKLYQEEKNGVRQGK